MAEASHLRNEAELGSDFHLLHQFKAFLFPSCIFTLINAIVLRQDSLTFMNRKVDLTAPLAKNLPTADAETGLSNWLRAG